MDPLNLVRQVFPGVSDERATEIILMHTRWPCVREEGDKRPVEMVLLEQLEEYKNESQS